MRVSASFILTALLFGALVSCSRREPSPIAVKPGSPITLVSPPQAQDLVPEELHSDSSTPTEILPENCPNPTSIAASPDANSTEQVPEAESDTTRREATPPLCESSEAQTPDTQTLEQAIDQNLQSKDESPPSQFNRARRSFIERRLIELNKTMTSFMNDCKKRNTELACQRRLVKTQAFKQHADLSMELSVLKDADTRYALTMENIAKLPVSHPQSICQELFERRIRNLEAQALAGLVLDSTSWVLEGTLLTSSDSQATQAVVQQQRRKTQATDNYNRRMEQLGKSAKAIDEGIFFHGCE